MNPARSILLLCCLLAWLSAVSAQSARLQDEQVYLGDIATLEIEYDNKIPSLYALDTAVLEADFEVLDIKSRTSRLVDGGEFSNRMQWEIRLLPRRAGRLRIPSLRLGGLYTPEVELEVLPLSPAIAADNQVAIEVVADPASPLIGQQTNLTLRLLYNTPVRDFYWTEPASEGADILRGIAESSYRLRRAGNVFEVNERVIAIFPRVQGELDIAPAGLRATIGAESASDRRQIYRNSAPLRLEVRDIPAGYSGRYWLPARDLELAQRWEGDMEGIRVGDSIGRVLTIVARGLPAKALPVDLLGGRGEAYGIYPDQARQEQRIDGRDIVGRLEQTFALIMTRAGETRIPDLSLRWWDVDAAIEREAVLPGRSMLVLPALAGNRASSDWLPANLLAALSANPWWLLAPAVVLALLVLAWRACAESLQAWLELRLRRSRAAAVLRRACAANDPRLARAALLQWAALRWPDTPPGGPGQIDERLDSSALGDELARLDRVLYALPASVWSGAGLWRELRAALRRAGKGRTAVTEGLAPLYPRAGDHPGNAAAAR